MKHTNEQDQKLTEILRSQLEMNGVSGVESYEWFASEPLYRGEPINGRATKSEMRAIIATYRAASQAEKYAAVV